MDTYRFTEEFMDFIRLFHGDRRYKAYARDIAMFFRLIRPYAYLDPSGKSVASVDWESLRSRCEYFLAKLSFDKRPIVRQMVIPEAWRILAELSRPEEFRRALIRDIAVAVAAYEEDSKMDAWPPRAG